MEILKFNPVTFPGGVLGVKAGMAPDPQGRWMPAVEVQPLLDELQGLREQEAALLTQVEMLEALRPHWAQGHTDDSIAAQSATNALSTLWGMLGATNQTEAVQKLQALTQPVTLNGMCDCTFPEHAPGVIYWRAEDVRKRLVK